MKQIALTRLDQALRNEPVQIIATVHDEAVMLVRVDIASVERIDAIAQKEMVAAFLEVFPDAPTLKLVDLKVGPTWGDLHSLPRGCKAVAKAGTTMVNNTMPRRPPRKTEAFHDVALSSAPEDGDLENVLERLGRPAAVTIEAIGARGAILAPCHFPSNTVTPCCLPTAPAMSAPSPPLSQRCWRQTRKRPRSISRPRSAPPPGKRTWWPTAPQPVSRLCSVCRPGTPRSLMPG